MSRLFAVILSSRRWKLALLRPSIAALAGVALIGFPTEVAADSTGKSGIARTAVGVHPPVINLGQSVTVLVRSSARLVDPKVRLVGSTTAIGLLQPWFPLQHNEGGVWSTTIPPVEQRGVYPVVLSTGTGNHLLRSGRWLIRVFTPGTLTRRSFATPDGVARDWVRKHGRLTALRRWPFSFHDLRLRALHQRLVAAYSPWGDPNAKDRIGIFITAVRISFGARWRLLEASVQP